MVQAESHSDLTSHKLKNILVPSPVELVFYVLLSATLAIIFNVSTIIKHLGNNYLDAPENLKASFSSLTHGFDVLFSTALYGRLGQIVLWSFIGAITYIALWLAKNVLDSFENDVIVARYLHPSSYSRAGYWESSLSVKVLLAASTVVTISYTFLLLTSVLPSIARLAASATYNFVATTSPVYLILCVAIGTLALYILRLLLRLIAHLWRLL